MPEQFEQCQVQCEDSAMVKSAYHHGDLGPALIDGALVEVRKVGAEKVSLRSVASAVGVSASAAYHYFPDKDALLGAAGMAVVNLLGARMQSAFDAIQGDDPKGAEERFRAIGMAYIEFAVEEPHLFRLAFGAYCINQATHEFAELREAGVAGSLLAQSLDDLLRHGVISQEARQYGEVLAWSAVHGLAMLILENQVPLGAAPALLDAIHFSLATSEREA